MTSSFQLAQALAFSLLCGISVCFCWPFPSLTTKIKPRLLCPLTSFAAGILLCLGLAPLLEDFALSKLLLCLGGLIFMALVDKMLHAHERRSGLVNATHTGQCAALAISLHNIFESFVLFGVLMATPALGFSLGAGMIAHSLPLGFAIAPAFADMRRRQVWAYAALAGLLPPLIAAAGYFLLHSLLSAEDLEPLSAVVGGILILIALAELLPAARQYGSTSSTLYGFGTGIAFTLCLLVFSI